MTVVAIMQPTYLPWMGYFAMMDRADIFVFLDSVQFARRSWQQRNRIKTANGAQMLTIPVFSKGKRDQPISETQIDWASGFADKHGRAIQLAYAKSSGFAVYSSALVDRIHEPADNLADFNIGLIDWLRERIGIECRLERSSNLAVSGNKAALLCDICRQVGGDKYLSAPGSKSYLEDADDFTAAGIPVIYNEFDHPIYPQQHGPFEPYMSAIDLLFNTGSETLDVIRCGYGA